MMRAFICALAIRRTTEKWARDNLELAPNVSESSNQWRNAKDTSSAGLRGQSDAANSSLQVQHSSAPRTQQTSERRVGGGAHRGPYCAPSPAPEAAFTAARSCATASSTENEAPVLCCAKPRIVRSGIVPNSGSDSSFVSASAG